MLTNPNRTHKDFENLFGSGDVPGLLSDEDVSAIHRLCELVLDKGTLVEIGSFLGKSTVEFARGLQKTNKSYKIITIDSFNTPPEVLKDLLADADFVHPEGCSTQLEMFMHYTQDYKNIKPIRGFFDQHFVFPEPVQAVFEDSTHSQEYLAHALPYWWEKLTPGGILAGHDYRNSLYGQRDSDVQIAVDIFAALRDLTVNTFENSSIWYIKK